MKLKNKMINIETTNLCNASCIICPRESFSSKKGNMKLELFKKIIDDAVQYDIQVIDTCGFGDPFLDNMFFERCKYAKTVSPGIKIYASSTCHYMTPDMLPQVLKYIDILKISSYGMSKETYESVHRGHIKYEQSMANIMQLLNEKERPYTIGLLVETDLNKDERDEWIRFWEPRLDEVFVWKPHNWVDYRSYREMDRSCQRTCGRPLNGPLYIHVDGTVSPCCWDINKRMVIGDINRQTIYEIIHSEVFAKIRHAHEMNNFSDLICCNCCQTNHRDDVLIYTNKGRQVGELTPNNIRLIKK